jgi:hypothetical protein
MQQVVYHFRFADGGTESLGVPGVAPDPASLPGWTRLQQHQCPNCPLSAASHQHCPLAVQLVPLVTLCAQLPSYEQVTVQVSTPQRQIGKVTTVQRAIGSLMGLLSAHSACPHVAFLKPMAYFHLPFSTEEETIYRVASMYLLAQYFRQRQGETPDWQLTRLKAHYEQLQEVNAAFAQRLREPGNEDGAVNALILLDLLAKALPYSIDDALEDVRAVFSDVV